RVLTVVFTLLLVPVAVMALLRAVVLFGLARRHARSKRVRRDSGSTPPVSVVVPAYNEAAGIQRTVHSLVQSDFPTLEVIVVDDGSRDGTGDLVEALGMDGVRVIRQANAGKAAALNVGIAAARHGRIVTLDGDTVFEHQTMARLVAALEEPGVGAVAGNTKVGNR